MISYVIPTRNRSQRLAHTLARLDSLSREAHEQAGGGEVLIIDNASTRPPEAPSRLSNGLATRIIPRPSNEAAAARNVAADEARGRWLVMLDDDSWPLDARFVTDLLAAPPDVAAVGAEIDLPAENRRQEGGLPEVFVGCAAAVRTDAFRRVGGYDPAFGYYAEEYDLAAKLLLAGFRVAHTRAFRAAHNKAPTHRNMDRILHALVRNNGWVVRRYAPDDRFQTQLDRVIRRYEAIARKEGAIEGFRLGLEELERTLDRQPRRPMSEATHDRFTGLAAAREGLRAAHARRLFDSAALVAPGKNAWAIEQGLDEIGVASTAEPEAEALVVASLSPGPAMDAAERLAEEQPHRRRVIPWRPTETLSAVAETVVRPTPISSRL